VDENDDLVKECQQREEFLERMDLVIEALNNTYATEDDIKNGWEWIHKDGDEDPVDQTLSLDDAKGDIELKIRIGVVLLYRETIDKEYDDWGGEIDNLMSREKGSLEGVDARDVFKIGDRPCYCDFCRPPACPACEAEVMKHKKELKTYFTKFRVEAGYDEKMLWEKLSKVERAAIIGTDDVLKSVALDVIANKGHQLLVFANSEYDIPYGIKTITIYNKHPKPNIEPPRPKKIKI
jgi:hypothetical protein